MEKQKVVAVAPNLAKVGVEGSNPFARSKILHIAGQPGRPKRPENSCPRPPRRRPWL